MQQPDEVEQPQKFVPEPTSEEIQLAALQRFLEKIGNLEAISNAVNSREALKLVEPLSGAEQQAQAVAGGKTKTTNITFQRLREVDPDGLVAAKVAERMQTQGGDASELDCKLSDDKKIKYNLPRSAEMMRKYGLVNLVDGWGFIILDAVLFESESHLVFSETGLLASHRKRCNKLVTSLQSENNEDAVLEVRTSEKRFQQTARDVIAKMFKDLFADYSAGLIFDKETDALTKPAEALLRSKRAELATKVAAQQVAKARKVAVPAAIVLSIWVIMELIALLKTFPTLAALMDGHLAIGVFIPVAMLSFIGVCLWAYRDIRQDLHERKRVLAMGRGALVVMFAWMVTEGLAHFGFGLGGGALGSAIPSLGVITVAKGFTVPLSVFLSVVILAAATLVVLTRLLYMTCVRKAVPEDQMPLRLPPRLENEQAAQQGVVGRRVAAGAGFDDPHSDTSSEPGSDGSNVGSNVKRDANTDDDAESPAQSPRLRPIGHPEMEELLRQPTQPIDKLPPPAQPQPQPQPQPTAGSAVTSPPLSPTLPVSGPGW